MISPVSPSEAIARVVHEIGGRTGTSWVGIDGLGASGKTTLAEALSTALAGSVVVHVDDFARPDLPGWELQRFVVQVRDPLLAGRPALYQRWNWSTNTGAEWIEVRPGGPVIVEGVSSTDTRLGVPWDFTIWVDVPREMRVRRALERDGEAMMHRWLNDWIPSEEDYVRRQQPRNRVDLIVDGATAPEPVPSPEPVEGPERPGPQTAP